MEIHECLAYLAPELILNLFLAWGCLLSRDVPGVWLAVLFPGWGSGLVLVSRSCPPLQRQTLTFLVPTSPWK